MYSARRLGHRGSALLIALMLVVLLVIVATGFLERILAFSQNGKWVQASTQAYYYATSILETQLNANANLRTKPWETAPASQGTTGYGTGADLQVLTGGTTLPVAGQWNSPFDPNFNIIAMNQPVQIVIPSGVSWSNVKFYFQVPNQGSAVISNAQSGAILWTVGNNAKILYASGEVNTFVMGDIDGSPKTINQKTGISLLTTSTFDNFYTNPTWLWPSGSACSGFSCTLKLSMLRPIKLSDWRVIPFLNYKIDFITTTVPGQFMTLTAQGYMNGYLRQRIVQIPQITSNTALDFAVLQ